MNNNQRLATLPLFEQVSVTGYLSSVLVREFNAI